MHVFRISPEAKIQIKRIIFMKKSNVFSSSIVFVLIIGLLMACSMSTANMSSLVTSTDKEGKSSATSFKVGDTMYGAATISNNSGKVKVKLYLTDSKNESVKGSEVSLDLDGDAVARYNLTLPDGFAAGTYKLNADMYNDANEKKDSKSVNITVSE
jgi:hypothetical protein